MCLFCIVRQVSVENKFVFSGKDIGVGSERDPYFATQERLEREPPARARIDSCKSRMLVKILLDIPFQYCLNGYAIKLFSSLT